MVSLNTLGAVRRASQSTPKIHVRVLQEPGGVTDGIISFPPGSQEARVAKGGTGGAGVGAGGGVHNPSNRLPAGMLTNPAFFLFIPNIKTMKVGFSITFEV